MTPQYSSSAALLFTEQELGGPCTENETILALTALVANAAVNGNGDRVGLIFVNLDSQAMYLSLTAQTGANGIELSANGGSLTMNVRDDFTLCSRAWYATTGHPTASLYVLEIIRFTTNTLTQGGV